MASVLVIGGSGFFGKSIADAYARGLLAPWGIDRLLLLARSATVLAKSHPELLTPGVELIDVDITQTAQLPWAHYVIHAAASTDARKYLTVSEAEKTNLLAATANFCRLAPRDLQGSRIVYASSGAVYGVQAPHQAQLHEDMPLEGSIAALAETKRDYASAKRDSEAMIVALGQTGMAVSIARCFAFLGAYLPRDQHFAIGNFLGQALAQQTIVVKAASPVVRSYLYADDLVRWLMHLAARASPTCPIWNVGAPEGISVLDLAATIAARFGVTVKAPPQAASPIDRYVPGVTRAQNAGMYHLDLNAALTQTVERIHALGK
jgi:nucleoside-diphosphate-sugar epimerase